MSIRNLGFCLALTAAAGMAVAGESAISTSQAASAKAVEQAAKSLGYSIEQHKDAKGNPHFVFKDKVEGAKSVAVFMEDCASDQCEDVTFYADFGSVPKMKATTLNEWNHVGSKLRSRAFRSGGVDNAEGPVGISSTVSYIGEGEEKELAMQLGLFLIEVKMFTATINNL